MPAPSGSQAFRASAFTSSIGINTHLGANIQGNAYTNVANIMSGINYLGVKAVRDGVYPASTTNVAEQQAYVTLANAGIHFDLCVGNSSDLAGTMAGLAAFAKHAPHAIGAVEGANEIDNFLYSYNGLTGQPAAEAFQTALYNAVHSVSNLNGVPVFDYTDGVNQSLAGRADFANIHPYSYNGLQPAWFIGSQTERFVAGSRHPMVITEVGYNTNTTASHGVNLDAQATMTLNVLFDAFQAGISQTYLYELLDNYADPGNAVDGDHWGLFNADGTPKPAAIAIHNLQSILADLSNTAATFAPSRLPYSIPNLPSGARSLLLQSSDGSFEIVLWSEITIWDPNSQSEITIAPTAVEVDFGGAHNFKVYDAVQSPSPIQTGARATKAMVSLSAHPLIIKIN